MPETRAQSRSRNATTGFPQLILVLLGMWTLFGMIGLLQLYSSLVEGRHSFTLSRSFELGLGNAWLKAVLSIPVLWALLRFNTKPRPLPSRVGFYAALLVAFTAAHIALRPWLIPIYVIGANGSHYTYWQYVEGGIQSFTLDDALAFALTVTAFHVWRYASETRLRAVREQSLRIQLANAELSILKMQLQPHFLFNTLNTIHCLAAEDSRKAQQMIERLSRLLRLSLDHLSSNAVPFSREMEFLQAYLDIETTRFEERLRVDREIDPSVLDAKVPSMILQPLVENAIRHGIGKIAGGGSVRIRAQRNGNRVLICVSNDYRPSNGAARTSGMGLGNTRARLTQMFGEDFSFRLEQGNDVVQVKMEIPFVSADDKQLVPEDSWSR